MTSLHSFPPIIGADARVLVLGTMPGAVSLKRREYYAHERNRFWQVMENLVGVPAGASYPERLEGLRTAGIGLWDTLKHCDREGSLDANIRNAEPNDFVQILTQYPSVHGIALNGRKAAEVFGRRVSRALPRNIAERLTVLALPSTSPANARGGFAALMNEWRRMEDWVGGSRT